MIGFGQISIEYQWADVLSGDGKPYRFPDTVSSTLQERYSKPAVYRWVFLKKFENPYAAYIGEAEDLASRIINYLRAHPSQKTNYRMKAEFEAAILKGAEVRLQVLQFTPFALNTVVVIDSALHNQHIRKMLESFVIADNDNVTCELMNRTLNSIERRRLKAAAQAQGKTRSDLLQQKTYRE